MHLQFKRNILFSFPVSCVPKHFWSFSDLGSGEEEGARWLFWKRAKIEWGRQVYVGVSALLWVLWRIPGPYPKPRELECQRAMPWDLCSFKAPLSDSDHRLDLETTLPDHLSLCCHPWTWRRCSPWPRLGLGYDQIECARLRLKDVSKKGKPWERQTLFSAGSRWSSHSFNTYYCAPRIYQVLF